MSKEAAENKTPALTEVDRKAIEAAKLRAEGRSWRACGEAVGMDPSNLRKALVARGYQESPQNRRDQLAELFGRAAIEGAKQILERLEAGERITAKETAVIAAICADKVALAEAWARSANEDASDWLQCKPSAEVGHFESMI
jgi:hypothetical protein